MVVQLIYISASLGITIDKIDNFIEGARSRNLAKNLTSIMLITNDHYIHCIEGERSDVSELYNKISHDPRHGNCTILRFNEIPKREFAEFSAEFSRLSDFDTCHANTVCPSNAIDPESITAAAAMVLLRRVAAHHRADKI